MYVCPLLANVITLESMICNTILFVLFYFTDTVLAEFPGTNVSDVRAVIRRKCNNENFVTKKKQ